MNRIKGIVAAALALPLLVACSSAYQDVYDAARYAFSNATAKDVTLSAERIAEFPYSGLYIRRGKQPQAFIVLGYIDQVGNAKQYSWISADSITIVTEAGRIVKTIGQTEVLTAAELAEHDLIATSNRSTDPLHCLASHFNTSHANNNVNNSAAHCPLTYERQIDYFDRGRARSTIATSRFTVAPAPSITTLPGGDYQTYYVIEDGIFQANGKTFRNEFWLEADGHVLRSNQQIKPNDARITLEQVKWIGRHE